MISSHTLNPTVSNSSFQTDTGPQILDTGEQMQLSTNMKKGAKMKSAQHGSVPLKLE